MATNWTLQDIQNNIATEIDQSATAPTLGGTDWNIRVSTINRALLDWSESYDWKALLKVHNGLISTSTGNATYALPTDFKKLDGFVRVNDGVTTWDMPEVSPTFNRRYTEGDKYVNVLGNNKDGNFMYISANTLPSGASVQFTYFASPVSLSTTTSKTECPDPTFLTQRTLYYLYKAREDGRFPEAKVESDRILARMIEQENSLGVSNVNRSINQGEKRYSFRIGRD